MSAPDDSPPKLDAQDMTGESITFQVSMIDFPDGSRGVAIFLPEDLQRCLPMTTDDAAQLLAAIGNCIRTATEFNLARAAGAVGRMQ